MNLYELTGRQAAILSMLSDVEDGEIPDDLAAELDALDSSIEKKVEYICQLVAGLDYERNVLSDESARLLYRADSCEKRASSLKRYIQDCLERSGRKKVQTPLFTVWVQQSAPSIHYSGELGDLSPKYQRITVEVNKRKAMEDYKATGELPAGFTVSQGTFLRIK